MRTPFLHFLPESDPSVFYVSRELKHGAAAALPEEQCTANIVTITACNAAFLHRELIEFYEATFKENPPTAILYIVATSGAIPYRDGTNLRNLMLEMEERSVPQFAVKYASYPQLAGRTGLLQCYGVTVLDNAFSAELDQVAYNIHRAAACTTAPNVLESALYWHYRQSQYPPRGWGFGGVKMDEHNHPIK